MGATADVAGTARSEGEQHQDSKLVEGSFEHTLPVPEEGAAAPAPRAARRPPWRAQALLAGTVFCVASAEAWLLASPAVPWLLDKAFLLVCLLFQALMGLALLPLAPAGCRSGLLDVCHWAFVLLVHAGALLFRAPECVLLIGAMALATVASRLCMRNRCLITAAAQRSSLPNIRGRTVTRIFLGLLLVSALRLCLMAAFGWGFPIDQIAGALSAGRAAPGAGRAPGALLA